MPRHKQPLELAKLKGTAKQNPGRYQNRPPKSSFGIGASPKHLTKEVKKCWDEIVDLAPAGALGKSSRLIVEATAILLEHIRNPGDQGIENPKMAQFVRNLGLMHMTPVDQLKLGVTPPAKPKENDFEKFR